MGSIIYWITRAFETSTTQLFETARGRTANERRRGRLGRQAQAGLGPRLALRQPGEAPHLRRRRGGGRPADARDSGAAER